jgi:hypothetical protein
MAQQRAYADRHAPLDVASGRLAGSRHGLIERRQRVAGRTQQGLPGAGKTHRLTVAYEQLNAQLGLHPAHRAAEHGQRHRQALRRVPEMQLICDRHKIAKLARFQTASDYIHARSTSVG